MSDDWHVEGNANDWHISSISADDMFSAEIEEQMNDILDWMLTISKLLNTLPVSTLMKQKINRELYYFLDKYDDVIVEKEHIDNDLFKM